MVQTMVLEQRLPVGAVVAESFRLARDNAALLVPIAIVSEGLTRAVDWLLRGHTALLLSRPADGGGAFTLASALLQLPDDLIRGFAIAAMIWIAYMALVRRPTSAGGIAGAVARAAIPIVLLKLAGTAMMTVADLIVLAMTAFPLLGLALFAWLPAVAYTLLCWWVAIPAAMVDGRDAIGAIRRSIFLTHGHRGAIAGIFLVIAIVFIVPGAALWVAAGSASPKHPVIALLSPIGLIATALQVLAVMVVATSTAAIYARLRAVKDPTPLPSVSG